MRLRTRLGTFCHAMIGAALTSMLLIGVIHAAPGDLDTTFSGDGKVTTDVTGAFDRAFDVVVTADGRILVAGTAQDGTDGNWPEDVVLARYQADGGLDATFGDAGIVTTDIAGDDDAGRAMTLQDDGRIVVVGGTAFDFALVRYHSDGTLDTSLGTTGIITTDLGSSSEMAESVALQPDGKIVAVGTTNGNVALVRYNPDGSLDTGFGTGGIVTTDLGGVESGKAVALQSDGKIVVGGKSGPSATDDTFALLRYNGDGTLDTGFDTDGVVLTDFGSGQHWILAVTLQGDGKIVVTGKANSLDLALARYNADGSLDSSFASGGTSVLDLGGSNDAGYGLALQADGKIVVAGGTNGDFALVRYDSNGTLDASFGTGGMLITDLQGGSDNGSAVALQSDGKVIVAGNAYVSATYQDLALARYEVAEVGTESVGAGAASIALPGVTITNNSGEPCEFNVTKVPVPPGGDAESGEMPMTWEITSNCGDTLNVDMAFAYTDAELANADGVTEGGLAVYKYANGVWTLQGGTVDAGGNVVTVTGVTSLSDWTLASTIPTAVSLASFAGIGRSWIALGLIALAFVPGFLIRRHSDYGSDPH